MDCTTHLNSRKLSLEQAIESSDKVDDFVLYQYAQIISALGISSANIAQIKSAIDALNLRYLVGLDVATMHTVLVFVDYLGNYLSIIDLKTKQPLSTTNTILDLTSKSILDRFVPAGIDEVNGIFGFVSLVGDGIFKSSLRKV